MTVSPSFRWTLAILATLALVALGFERLGWLDRFMNRYDSTAPLMQTDNKAAEGDSVLASALDRFEKTLPRIFPQTTDINQALNKYAESTDLSERTELAYDLVALKMRAILHQQPEFTPPQEKIYANALAHLEWTTELFRYYLNRLPETGTVKLALGEHQQSISSQLAKKILAASMTSAKAECTDDDFGVLAANFSEEQVALHGTDLMRVFLVLNGTITNQLLDLFQQRVLEAAAQNPDHQKVMRTTIKLRERFAEGRKEYNEQDKRVLKEFFDNKNRDAGFLAYASAPECFRPTAAPGFLKKIHRLQSELRGRHYVLLIKAYYKKNRRVPDDLAELENSTPLNDKEQFYSRARDGWNGPLQMKFENNRVRLISNGPDFKAGTEDDFVAAEGNLDSEI